MRVVIKRQLLDQSAYVENYLNVMTLRLIPQMWIKEFREAQKDVINL